MEYFKVRINAEEMMLFDEVCLNSVILLHDLLYFPGGLVSKKIGSGTKGLKNTFIS